jgi:hypothetical protein
LSYTSCRARNFLKGKSGHTYNEQEIRTKAMDDYEAENGKPFGYMLCWNEMRHHSKYSPDFPPPSPYSK